MTNKREKKETDQSIINEHDADTGFSFKTFGKSDSVTEKDLTAHNSVNEFYFNLKKILLNAKKQ